MSFTGQTRICGIRGSINLKDFPKGDLIKKKGNTSYYKVPDGIRVLTIWNNKKKWVKPEMFSIHTNLNMLNVFLSSGYNLQCSDDHSLVGMDNNLNYYRTKAKLGLCVPRVTQRFPISLDLDIINEIYSEGIKFKLDKDLGYVFGIIIGDGWVTEYKPKHNSIYLATTYPKIKNKFIKVLKSYGHNGKVYSIDNPHLFENKESLSIKHTVTFKPLANILHGSIGYGSLNKKLPLWWIRTSLEFRWGLFSGLLDTDGSISISNKQVRCSYSTSSSNLAFDIMSLSASLDLKCSLTTHRRKHKENFEYVITFTRDSLKKIKDHVCLYNDDKRKKLNKYKESKDLSYTTTPNIDIDKFLKIRPLLKTHGNVMVTDHIRHNLLKSKNGELFWLKKDVYNILYESNKEVMKNDPYWKELYNLTNSKDIEWVCIKKINRLDSVTEAYDLTVPPYNTFVLDSSNGVVVYDTVSFTIVYTEESVKEIDQFLKTNKAYLTTDNKIMSSSSNGVSEQVTAYMTE